MTAPQGVAVFARRRSTHRATFRKIKHSVQVLFIGIVYMAPPPTLEHLSILNKEFYDNYNFFGRDKLFNILREKYGEEKSPSRRQIADWLKQQEVNQIYTPSKGKAKTIKSSMTIMVLLLFIKQPPDAVLIVFVSLS